MNLLVKMASARRPLLMSFVTLLAASVSTVNSSSQRVLSSLDNADLSPVTAGLEPFISLQDPSLARWANIAYEIIQNMSCDRVLIMTKVNCRRLQATVSSGFAIYYAQKSSDGGKYTASMPRGERLRHNTRHDVVFAMDPSPHRRSAHHMLVFFVDLGVDKASCELNDGFYLGSGECLIFALKRGCHGLNKQLPGLIKFGRRCETKYLPRVHLASEERENRLICAEHLLSGTVSTCLQEDNENHSHDDYDENCDPIKDKFSFYKCLQSRVAKHGHRLQNDPMAS